jgi:uncharacterized lipoprotein YmbA
MKTINAFRISALGLVALALTGTVGCFSASPQSRFYQLALSTGSSAPIEVDGAPVVVMGPIVIAPYLSKPQVVTRLGDNEVRYEEMHRWSEPLREGIPVMVYDLAQGLLPEGRIVQFLFENVGDADLQVTIGVLRLDGDAKGKVQLRARWSIRDPKTMLTLVEQDSHLEGQAVNGRVVESIRVHGELLEQLTRTIMAEVQRVLDTLPAKSPSN